MGRKPDIVFEAIAATTQFDSGVRVASAFSARAAYVSMCLTLCWGIFTATGWIQKASGHQAMRGSHTMFAALTLGTALTHVSLFTLLDDQVLTLPQILIPFADGTLRRGFGVIALWLLVAITLTGGLHRVFRYRNWLRLHQLAYPAVVLGITHSWLGAYFNGNLSLLWIGGISITAPVVLLTVLRVLPPQVLVRAKLIDGEMTASSDVSRPERSLPLQVSVDNQRCHRYGFCQAEAPDVFQLREDGRLAYRERPDVTQNPEVRSASRACPMRAIRLDRAAG
jgi:ferredoxin/DMSO/TMAO reductase YedYZ heme-binding membrane subunit